MLTKSDYRGCFLGLAYGDALGAPYEGGFFEQLLWKFIGRTNKSELRWTDDTQMALDLAESLIAHHDLNLDDLAFRFGDSYKWSRGYGPSTAKILKKIRRGYNWESASKSIYLQGSYGNGAAMRSPVLALFNPVDVKRLVQQTVKSAAVTHAHPLGIEGAVIIAVATQSLLNKNSIFDVLSLIEEHCSEIEFKKRFRILQEWLLDKELQESKIVVEKLGNSMTAPLSCMTALYVALSHIDQSFENLISTVISYGGDVDTIGSMAGAMWGAFNGEGKIAKINIEDYEKIIYTADCLHEFYKINY